MLLPAVYEYSLGVWRVDRTMALQGHLARSIESRRGGQLSEAVAFLFDGNASV